MKNFFKKLFNFSFLNNLYILNNDETDGFYKDYLALKSDWSKVGNYIKDSMTNIEKTYKFKNAKKLK